MILFTTSHRPSPRTRSFIKDLASIIPFAQRVNRGHKSLVELALETKRLGYNYLAIVSEKHGNPSMISLYEIVDGYPYPSTKSLAKILLKGVKLSRENPEASRAYSAKTIGVDFSRCISGDCYYLSDLLIRIFSKIYSDNPDLKLILEEDAFIVFKCINVHGRVIGPVLRISKVIREVSNGSFS